MVKHVALLRDDRPCWNEVVKYLRDANVKVTLFDGEWEPEDVIGLSPDMVVTNLLNLSHMKISLRRIPKVAIQVGEKEQYLLPTSRVEWNIRIVPWPVKKDEFLEITSNQLTVSPRKTYACIFQLSLEDDDAMTAQTVDLSMTGLAFKTIGELEVGQKVGISLSLPDTNGDLTARAKVIRSAEEDSADPRTIYGAEYIEPSDEFSRALKKFIHVY